MDMDKGIIHYNISGFNRFVWNKSDMFLKMVMNQRFVIIYKKTYQVSEEILLGLKYTEKWPIVDV